MPAKPVIIRKKDSIATLVLNRPGVMNAMNKEMILGLYDAVNKIARDEAVQVVILKGSGDHFSSGADLALFSENLPPNDRPSRRGEFHPPRSNGRRPRRTRPNAPNGPSFRWQPGFRS